MENCAETLVKQHIVSLLCNLEKGSLGILSEFVQSVRFFKDYKEKVWQFTELSSLLNLTCNVKLHYLLIYLQIIFQYILQITKYYKYIVIIFSIFESCILTHIFLSK